MSESPDETATPSGAAATTATPTSSDDLLPVLPKGDPLFDGIPTRAVVLEELAPALGDGALVVRRATQVGVILIRERTLFEIYAFSPTDRTYGQAALAMLKSWDDATVSAYRLDPELVDVCPSLLRGETLYSDLRLNWCDWNQLLADLSARDGNYVIEVRTPKGRGVTCVANGKQIATFTEAHPELGPPSLLDALAAARTGSVFVHSEPSILDAEEWAAAQNGSTAAAPSPAPAPAAAPAPAPTPAPATAAAPAPAPAAATETAAVNPFASPAPTNGSAAPSAPIVFDTMPPAAASATANADDDADNAVEDDVVENPFAVASGPVTADSNAGLGANPFAAVFDAPVAEPPNGGSLPVADLLDDLKTIARNRLQRSAARVEATLDDAAAQNKTLDEVLDDIRGLVIRGVMQSTLDEVVDDMRSLAATHAA